MNFIPSLGTEPSGFGDQYFPVLYPVYVYPDLLPFFSYVISCLRFFFVHLSFTVIVELNKRVVFMNFLNAEDVSQRIPAYGWEIIWAHYQVSRCHVI